MPIACKKRAQTQQQSHRRYNQDIDDRYKTTRHWNSFESTKATLKLRQIIHNFVNPHIQLNGKTPAEAAEIKIDLGKNKLLKIIELAYMPKN